ncbi:MAG: DDE-type integrase/transposase/recombinase [Alphaproteobacteria bacterium]|nr:DDE-type integrase/transposase/recombinase [Alphaproteobacteria bacterium]MBT5390541.1 DDE-type integrase/transposase/recombinase [Alphaproteobacteria bacterium]
MTIKLNDVHFILWRTVDSEGHELDIFLQKRRNKKAEIRFLSRLLGAYPEPREAKKLYQAHTLYDSEYGSSFSCQWPCKIPR